jgi:cellulose synthase/poly-beta-1,6-N-acetylglucosamine synthase-like glycosyltransferase
VRGARRGGDPAADCRPEALVFTDANTVFRRDAVRVLVGRLADPGVGGVCGRLVLKPTAPGTIREAAYWEGENRLKALESDVDSCLGANGGIYAVRPELFWAALPENTIADDFVVGMKVREQGSRTVYEGSAVAWEDLPPTVGHEWGRRVRIGAGAFQALGLCRRCLLPRYGAFAWMFWSHKVLRWFTPHLLLVFGGLAVAALAGRGAAGSPLVRTVSLIPAALVLLAAATAGLGALLGSARNRAARPFQMAAYFAAMQAALFAGFLRFCRGNLSGAWERTERRAATGACTSQ